MAGSTTTYKVDVVYDLKGNAGRGLKSMANDAKQATASFGGLRSVLALVGGGALFTAGKRALIDFNSDVQKLKIGLATVTSMNMSTPFEVGQKAADRLFNTFQKMATQSPATTKDFVEMANMISSGVFQAGMGLKDLEQMTKGAITASSALGARPEMLALDVTQMLAGTVAIRDRYARQLLAGIGQNDYKAFNAKSAADRAKLVKQAFDQPALKDAADAFGQSFEGVTSTLKDNLEIALGKVGLPLMRELTSMVKGWNQWIEQNPEKVAAIIDKLSSGIREAFSLVKDMAVTMFPIIKDVFGVIQSVAGFMVDNRDLLISTVKGLLVYKGLQTGMGILGAGKGGLMGLFRGGTGALDKLRGTNEAEGGLLSFASTLTSALGPLGKFVGLLAGVATLPLFLKGADDFREEDAKKRAAEMKTVMDYQKASADVENLRTRLLNIGIDPYDKTADVGGLKKEMNEINAAKSQYEAAVIKKGIELGAVREELDKSGTRRVTLLGAGGAVSKELMDSLDLIFRLKAREAAAAQAHGLPGMPLSANYFGVGGNIAAFEEYVGAKTDVDLDALRKTTKPEVNVNINKIEVYSDDPDRFVHQAVNSFEEIVRNPTAARDIVRGAF